MHIQVQPFITWSSEWQWEIRIYWSQMHFMEQGFVLCFLLKEQISISIVWPTSTSSQLRAASHVISGQMSALFVSEAAAEVLMTTRSDGCWFSASAFLTSNMKLRLLQQQHEETLNISLRFAYRNPTLSSVTNTPGCSTAASAVIVGR